MSEAHIDWTKIHADLASIARDAGLVGEAASTELRLREHLIDVERKLFLTRIEKGKILDQYRSIYSPLGLFSRFLQAIAVPRKTAYRWMDEAEGPCVRVTQRASAPVPMSDRGHSVTTAQVLRAVRRQIERLPERYRLSVVAALVDEYGTVPIEDDLEADEAA